MAAPRIAYGTARPTSVASRTQDAGIALPAEHPIVRLAWLLAGVAIAAGIGPWVSQYAGVMLPAFALIRTRRQPRGA